MSSFESFRLGLFSSEPNSQRMRFLERAFSKLGVSTIRIVPWLINTHISNGTLELFSDSQNLFDFDMIFVIDLGAEDLGSYYNRIGILSTLSNHGVSIINPVESIIIMRNKGSTLQHLARAGVHVPETLITESIQEASEFITKNAPCVLKPLTGFGGQGVKLISNEFDIAHSLEYLKYHNLRYGKGAYLVQQYVQSPGYDIRALVVDEHVIASMRRISTQGFLYNIHAGATPAKNDTFIDDIAIRAARAVSGRVVGVDIIPDLSGNLWVLEVNATPGWSGLQTITEFDISEKIARIILGQ